MELAINQKQPQKAAELYMGDPFIQHNPQNADGKEAFVTWANGLIAVAPGVNVDVKRVLGDGDLVMVHSHFTVSATDRGLAVADMFRIKNGKIVEHWDVIQAVPETSANDNTMF
jgi:predicted SnoaL-like aldol condensation-catalyzing enzyme